MGIRVVLLTLAVQHISLPFASPFAAGSSHAGSIASPLSLSRRGQSSAGVNTDQTPSVLRSPTAYQQHKTDHGVPPTARYMSATAVVAEDGDPSWKSGEANASVFSRLLFQYASPLLHVASQRRLNADDSFHVPEGNRMDRSVTSLSRIYDHLRTVKARRKVEKQQKRRKRASANEGSEQSTEGSSAAEESLILTQALLLQQRRTLLYTACLRLLNTGIQAFPALLVSRLLRLIEAGDTHSPTKALSSALMLVFVLSMKMITENAYFHSVVKMSTDVRGSLAGLIFDKSLRLPGGGSGVAHATASSGNGEDGKEPASLGAGGVLNLMQSDTSIIESAALQFHTIWDGPLQIMIYTTLLYRYLGPPVFWGIGVLLLTIPVNSITLRILNRLSKYENEAKDARTKRTSESISNMKLLKLQGWENRFADDIRNSRREELRRHVARGVVRALSTAFSNAVPALVLVVTLTAYVKTGQPLVASTIFTAISLFNQLRFPLFFYPMLVDALANGRNAMKRLATYTSAEEIVPYVETLPIVEGIRSGGSIQMSNGNFLWPTSKSAKEGGDPEVAPALIDAELKVNPGEVVAVVGGVGSGKSALLKGLLGELTPAPKIIVEQSISPSFGGSEVDETGHIERTTVLASGNIAYCSQEAWLPKGTIKDAIVFGRDYDEKRYLAAIRDSGLDKDIVDNASSDGALHHDTDVGEGGSSLSGGQRARVALARALYSDEDTKVFLLDDCLAALDASVGSTVFERLTARLRSSKSAALLVTNDPSIPRRCDRVVLMGKVESSTSCSRVVDIGTYDELIARGHDLRRSSSTVLSSEALARNVEQDEENSKSDGEASTRPGESGLPPAMISETKKVIQVVGGYEPPPNCTGTSCHADPECQVAMQNCPDFVADQVSQEVRNVEDNFPDEFIESNSTIDVFTVHSVSDITEESDEEGAIQNTTSVSPKIASADDVMSSGAVPISTYVSYLKAVRQPLLIGLMLSSYLMANGAQFFQQYTIAKWTEVGQGSAMGVAMGAKYMRSLVNAAGVVSVFLWFRSFLTMQVGVRASEFLHSRMLNSVFAAPMAFFDATPSGQLLSRFGKEIETVDRAVPDSIGSVLFCFLQIFMSIGALAGVVTPGMLVPLSLVSFFYVKAMSLFRPAARDMKRAETKTRSPIYTHFGEALRGAETIRSIPGAPKTWSSTHRSLSDKNLAVFYTVKAFDRWLSTRLETLGNTVVFTAAVASVFLTRSGRLKAGSAGWGLTQALAITGLLTWAVRTLTDLETNMMSVMRVKELTDLDSERDDDKYGKTRKSKPRMPKEPALPGVALEPLLQSSSFNASLAPLESTSLRHDGWPYQGRVEFCNVSMRYNPSAPLVLDGVSLVVPAGTTLGVVGRTGSGKSSLLLTLFRLVEIESGGSIEIDGVDIRSVGLEDLRQSLAIIPQDPVLFAGSIAYNLDATGKASPEDMWEALEAASPSLTQQFRNSGGLDSQIVEAGKNLSLGQRQLICLARALLRKSKILVMDEATSSIDAKTDQEVQETIRREFVDKGVTVITVAHRLDTVLGYDKIAVLGDGRMLEYGNPDALLRIPRGELRRLVDADRRNKLKGSVPAQSSDTSTRVASAVSS